MTLDLKGLTQRINHHEQVAVFKMCFWYFTGCTFQTLLSRAVILWVSSDVLMMKCLKVSVFFIYAGCYPSKQLKLLLETVTANTPAHQRMLLTKTGVSNSEYKSATARLGAAKLCRDSQSSVKGSALWEIVWVLINECISNASPTARLTQVDNTFHHFTSKAFPLNMFPIGFLAACNRKLEQSTQKYQNRTFLSF